MLFVYVGSSCEEAVITLTLSPCGGKRFIVLFMLGFGIK